MSMPRRILDDPHDAQVENYAALFDERIFQLQQRMSSAKTLEQVAEIGLAKSIGQLRAAESRVFQAQDSQTCERDRHTDDFNRLLEHPDINVVEVNNNYIVVETETVKIEHAGTIYTIGRFEIAIRIDGFAVQEAPAEDLFSECLDDPDLWMVDEALDDSEPLPDVFPDPLLSDSITLINISNKQSDVDHPHVRDGLPCWGNIGPTISELLEQKRYPAVIALCIEFLKSYTDDGNNRPYLNIQRWSTNLPDPFLGGDDYHRYDDDDVPF
jgi:3-phenylpropionate/cinnamic acid dioxygenase small subunit